MFFYWLICLFACRLLFLFIIYDFSYGAGIFVNHLKEQGTMDSKLSLKFPTKAHVVDIKSNFDESLNSLALDLNYSISFKKNDKVQRSTFQVTIF